MTEYIEREAVLAEIENEYRDIEKIKTPFAKIIVGGTVEKPYHSIMWWDTEKRECNIGFSSYCLEYVFKWLEVVFEVTEDAFSADVAPVVHGEWIWNGKHWECSNCRHDRLHDLVLGLDAAYCPYCGADMRERKGEDDRT